MISYTMETNVVSTKPDNWKMELKREFLPELEAI